MNEKPRSSGALWSSRDKEKLRLLWMKLVSEFPGRTSASIHAMLNKLAQLHYRYDWPYQPLLVTYFQCHGCGARFGHNFSDARFCPQCGTENISRMTEEKVPL